MWEEYYYPLYSKYIKEINKQAQNVSWPSMIYLNKYYWDIALLSILCSDAKDNNSFLKNILGINNIGSIEFDINSRNYASYKESPVLNFIESLNKNPIFTLERFKGLLEKQEINIDTLFMYLYIAFTPNDKKILNAITINCKIAFVQYQSSLPLVLPKIHCVLELKYTAAIFCDTLTSLHITLPLKDFSSQCFSDSCTFFEADNATRSVWHIKRFLRKVKIW